MSFLNHKTLDGLIAIKANVAEIDGPTTVLGKFTVGTDPPSSRTFVSDMRCNTIVTGSSDVIDPQDPVVRAMLDANPGIGIVKNLIVGGPSILLENLSVAGTITTNATDFFKYEEGTWTPALPNVTASPFTITNASYSKMGNQVTLYFSLQFDYTSGGGLVTISGLPFTPSFDNQSGHIDAVNTSLQTVPPISDIQCSVVSGVIVLSTASSTLSWVGTASSQDITGNITYTS